MIYPLVDLPKINEENVKLIRKHYNLGNDPAILFVGRVTHSKGIHILIDVFKAVKRVIPNAKLMIVGRTDYTNCFTELKKIADESVIFTGCVPQDELPNYYAACNVYATCSLWEESNRTLVEAQLVGKPVVAFDIGPHREVVRDKETGFLIPLNDIRSFVDALIKLISDNESARKMGENAKGFAFKKFVSE